MASFLIGASKSHALAFTSNMAQMVSHAVSTCRMSQGKGIGHGSVQIRRKGALPWSNLGSNQKIGKYDVIKVAPGHASNFQLPNTKFERNNEHDSHLAIGNASTTGGEGAKKKRTRAVKSTSLLCKQDTDAMKLLTQAKIRP